MEKIKSTIDGSSAKVTSALLTDFYELTMIQGYYLKGNNPRVTFDYFYRTGPFGGIYTIFTGLDEVIDSLEGFSFSTSDIEYLRSLGMFHDDFLEYLKSYRFSGTLYALKEGSVAFPTEPLLKIETSLIDAQLVESYLLNTLNFQSLIATKASRMKYATKGHGSIMEFGFRRAQGLDGASSATRASFVGGVDVTSNTLAGKEYGIPVAGTMAHSWVMSYGDEEVAFREFADIYPDSAIFLIDTYNTLGSGIDAAIKIGLEQKAKGKKIGVRLDSGDLSYLSTEIRKKLDANGLEDAIIVVSNDLTEEIIHNLMAESTPIDSWGIGTNLVTGGKQSALNGVYKLAEKANKDGVMEPTIKISNNFEKSTNPGNKQVYRFYNENDELVGDLITLESQELDFNSDITFYHPFSSTDYYVMKPSEYVKVEPLLTKMMVDGKRVVAKRDLSEIKAFALSELGKLHESYKRQINPHRYKVSLSQEVKDLKLELISKSKESR